ncbi:hypothetical protein AgCh_012944 [Apium graveolens]
MEKAFTLTQVSDNLRSDYASYFLKDEANYWWESTRVVEGEGPDERSVAEYEAKFMELARLVPLYVSTKAQKAKRFQQGLKPEIRSGVVALQLKTYPSVVQAALVIESDQKLAAKEKGDKKNKRFRRQNFPQARPATASVASTPVQSSNSVVDCKRNSQLPVTTMGRWDMLLGIVRQLLKDSDVVAGTLSHNSIPIRVLFDSGASKSFMSKDCVVKMDLMLEDLAEPLTIEVANQDRVLVSQFCPKC